MNIFENKRAVALTGVFALAFAGVLVWGFANKSEADAAIVEANAKKTEGKSLASSSLAPNAETRDILNKNAKALEENVNIFKSDLKAYTDTCKAITADAISKETLFHPDHLKAARTWLSKITSQSGCTVPDGEGFTFGLDRNYNERNDAATVDTTPFLLFQLNAARTLAGYVAESGATSLDRMYCEPVPSSEDGVHTSLHIELSFTAQRGEIPLLEDHTSTTTQVINAILEGEGKIVTRQEEKQKGHYFFIIKGINANSNNSYGPIESYTEPFQTAGADGAAATVVAKRVTGLPDETVHVNLVVEAVYFSQNAN